jgi:hypothetical protein
LPPGASLVSHSENTIVLDLAGTIDPYMDWIRHQSLTGIHVEKVGLNNLYQAYHQPDTLPANGGSN